MNPWTRKVIAVFEVVGGLHGLVGCSVEAARRGFPDAELPLYALVMGFFLLSTAAGVLLWRNTRAGYIATIVVLLIQLPKLLYPQLAYMVNTGFDVTAVILAHPGPPPVSVWKLHLQIGSNYLVHAEPGQGVARGIGISLVSCVVLWVLARSRRASAPAVPPEPAPPTVTLPRYPSA